MTTSLLAEQLDPAALADAAAEPEFAEEEFEAIEPAAPARSRKSLVALSLCAIAINGTAALMTLPSELALPDVSRLAELLPQRQAPAPQPDPVVAALKDIQSAQQQHAAALQESNSTAQQNKALLRQDSMLLVSLRDSITDERVDVRKISSQLSTLIAKVDTLQNTMNKNAMAADVTSAIPRGHARNRLMMRKRMALQSKPVGPVSVGGAPLTIPAATPAPKS